MTATEIAHEKKRVKGELKNYDTAFSAIFKRLPNREEKEPMRPLYIYYKKLKQFMGKEPTTSTSQNNNIRQTSISSSTTSNSHTLNSQIHQRSNIGHNNHIYEEEKAPIVSHSQNWNRIDFRQDSKGETRLDSSFEINLSRDRDNHEPKINNYFNNNNSKSLTNNYNGGNKSSLGQGPSVNYEQSKKMLEELKQTRARLRDKLHSYQVDFTRNNNRRIKYHKDIVPVETEYKRYKEIKQEISRLENLLGLKPSSDSH